MAATSRSQARRRAEDLRSRSIRQSWWLFSATFVLLGVALTVRAALTALLFDVGLAILAFMVGFAAVLNRRAAEERESRRRTEAENVARILSGLSRAVSPDAIVEAIAGDLAVVTGADHVVVVRRRAGRRIVDATLVSARAGVPTSTTRLPAADLDDPEPRAAGRSHLPIAVPVDTSGRPSAPESRDGPPRAGVVSGLATLHAEPRGAVAWTAVVAEHGSPADENPRGASLAGSSPRVRHATAEAVTERLERRVRTAFGLKNTRAAPLLVSTGMAGAIVISRRAADPWPVSSLRLLAAAAEEVSMALVYSPACNSAPTRRA